MLKKLFIILIINVLYFSTSVYSQTESLIVEKDTNSLIIDTLQTEKQKKKFTLFKKKDQKDIVKKGISFGPLPVIAFDQDRGFQYGGLLNLYDYGDGSTYPVPRQQWYIEVSAYTKGSQQVFLTYDTKHLIPNVRMSIAATFNHDMAMDFYGFNGYQAVYPADSIKFWSKQKDKTGMPDKYKNAFFRLERYIVTAKADFVGNIWKNKFFWEASYYFSWNKYQSINFDKINKGKKEAEQFHSQTLFEKYQDWGIIPENEIGGGFTSALKAGLMFDTRDFEAAPSKGIWAEGHVLIAPKFMGTTHPYYRYSLTFRHYIPCVKDKLVLAYRLHYRGTIGNYMPYYILPVFSTVGREYDRDGMGGYRTVRGIVRTRVQALDDAFFNVELRWKFVSFKLWKQNIYLGLNAFCDGAISVRYYDVSYRGNGGTAMEDEYKQYISTAKDGLHAAAGGGFRIAINQNFIIAVDYAYPFNKQDGLKGSLYVNTGYLF
ncbi:MAG: BamA/TamA family outer membrane protein [Bacteroidales bacterium]|jgi:hypothetical protein|nr:BamA/TamA family outer membrane protein [Bacteroidales bacterium]